MDVSAAKGHASQLPRTGDLLALLPLVVAIVSLASLLLLVQTSRMATAGYDMRRLEQLRESWRQRNYELDVEVARLQSLERIEEEARRRFKMVQPSEYMYVLVEKSSPSRSVVSPEPVRAESPTPVERPQEHWWDVFLRPIFSR